MSTPTDLILTTATAISMTSREIAELTGKQHKHVLRDIDKMLEEIGPDLGQGFKTSTYTDDSGREYRQFILDRDSSYCLVAGYDANSRMRIIKRWQELENSLAPALPQDYPAALRALADETEARMLLEGKNRALQQQLETDKPYSELAKAITGQSTMTRRDWCALMKDDHGANITEKQLTNWLLDNHYIYRDKLDNSPRAYAGFSRYFKLEMPLINGYPRKVLMVTGTGVFELTPKVLADVGQEAL
jgi:phage regulator Rha-like protein